MVTGNTSPLPAVPVLTTSITPASFAAVAPAATGAGCAGAGAPAKSLGDPLAVATNKIEK